MSGKVAANNSEIKLAEKAVRKYCTEHSLGRPVFDAENPPVVYEGTIYLYTLKPYKRWAITPGKRKADWCATPLTNPNAC